MTWEELLSGWNMYKVCGCGGTRTHKHKKAGISYEVWVQPRPQKFKLFNAGRLQFIKPLSELEATLNQYQI